MKRPEAKKKQMPVGKAAPVGFTCRVCGKRKPREAYAGKGRRGYVCQDCASVSLPERIGLQQQEEIFHVLRQASISQEKRARLQSLASSNSRRVAALASLVLEVTTAYPQKKDRLKRMSRERPDLLEKLREAGLVMSH